MQNKVLIPQQEIRFSPGISIDSSFYSSKIFCGTICCEGFDSITIFFESNYHSYRLKISKLNLSEIIQVEANIFYMKTQKQPTLEKKKMGSFYQQTPYKVFNNAEDDELTKILLPHFLVIKLITTQQFADPLIFFFEKNRLSLCQGWYNDESWYNKPNFTMLLTNCPLTWQVKYSILVLLTNFKMKLEDLTEKNMKILNSYPNYTLANLFYSKISFDPNKPFINKTLRVCEDSKMPIKRVYITPTTIIFHPPNYEIGNRVVRKYAELSEYFLRVTFCDEKLKKTSTWSEKILKRFRRLLNNFNLFGIELEFLGFSNSQIKNHSCWMTLKFSDSLTEQIREELGDFSGCKNVAKYSARLGLCFTETHTTIQVDPSKIVTIPDIERNGYVFSDGIGKISPEYFFRIREILKVNSSEEICAVQIRLGGCKGVLVLAPEITDKIQIRPSMQKFESQDTELEVCNFSKFKPGYLNRQIILLLHGLGISEEVFLSIQENFILEIKNSYYKNPNNFISALKSSSISSELYELVTKFDKYRDNSTIKQAYNKYLNEIITKVRFPANDSALLMGVLDEYNMLSYDQVYIRVSRPNYSHVVTGKVVVAKNPCLHPGDIQILEAVDRNELAHLVNVVVFSQRGDRPLPNKCSGSDLDGDEYFVSWNQLLVPEEQYESMEYEKVEEVLEEVSAEKVKDYFIGYMKSEVLGTVDNLHLVHADLKGIFSEEALALAELHSKAVDYPKTGIQISIPNEYRVNKWPDFMEKSFSPSYESQGILGKLYRSAYSCINY